MWLQCCDVGGYCSSLVGFGGNARCLGDGWLFAVVASESDICGMSVGVGSVGHWVCWGVVSIAGSGVLLATAVGAWVQRGCLGQWVLGSENVKFVPCQMTVASIDTMGR